MSPASRAKRGNRGRLAAGERRVTPVPLEHKDPPVQRALLELRAIRAIRAIRVIRVIRATPEILVLPEPRVIRAIPVQQAHPDLVPLSAATGQQRPLYPVSAISLYGLEP